MCPKWFRKSGALISGEVFFCIFWKIFWDGFQESATARRPPAILRSGCPGRWPVEPSAAWAGGPSSPHYQAGQFPNLKPLTTPLHMLKGKHYTAAVVRRCRTQRRRQTHKAAGKVKWPSAKWTNAINKSKLNQNLKNKQDAKAKQEKQTNGKANEQSTQNR